MHTSAFFKYFPPPRFMVMRHAGLDISDDGIRCIQYSSDHKGSTIDKYSYVDLPDGVIEGGDIKNELALRKVLKEFDDKHDLSFVKVSIPEEKAYLFETEVPNENFETIRQNIEFKLEENVPLEAKDAVFYFDLIKPKDDNSPLRASVSVVPKSYVEYYLDILRNAGIFPVAFEVVPKAISRAIACQNDCTEIIVNLMKKKTGIYIVYGGIVSFTSTITWANDKVFDPAELAKEINRVYSYWMSRPAGSTAVAGIILVGTGADALEKPLRGCIGDRTVPVRVADVWRNVFDINKYVPPISRIDSLEYVVAAGLAMTT